MSVFTLSGLVQLHVKAGEGPRRARHPGPGNGPEKSRGPSDDHDCACPAGSSLEHVRRPGVHLVRPRPECGCRGRKAEQSGEPGECHDRWDLGSESPSRHCPGMQNRQPFTAESIELGRPMGAQCSVNPAPSGAAVRPATLAPSGGASKASAAQVRQASGLRRKRAHRLLAALVGQLERAPVHRDAPARADVPVRAHGLGRVHVRRAHEPARLVGADGEQRQVRGAAAPADLGEERLVVARVPREIDEAPARARA